MTKRYLRSAIVLIVVGITMFGLAPRSDWPVISATLAVGMLLVGALMTPAIRDLARKNKRMARTAGLISIGLAICALAAGLALSPPIFSTDVTVGAFSILLILGMLLFQLPGASASVESALDAQKVAERVRPTLGGFHPVEEVKATYAYLWRNKASLAKVAGPWLLAICVMPVLLFHPDFWNGIIGHNRALAQWVLAGFVAFILTEFCFVLAVSIQWMRFVATGREPRWFSFPGKAVWGLFWRWIIFGSIFRATHQIAPWLKAHIEGASSWELLALDKLCLLAILVLASPFALGLPSIALNEPSRSAAARTLAFGIAGRKYYLGSVLILAPFLVLLFVLDLLFDQTHNPSITTTLAMCEAALLFCLLVVGTTYVTRLYVNGVAAAA